MIGLIIVIGLLLLWNIIITFLFMKQTGDLLDRLMSKNFVEYKLITKKEEPEAPKPEAEEEPKVDLSMFEEDWEGFK